MVSWVCAQAAFAQALNPTMSYYGQPNQLGSATFSNTFRNGPTGAPIGISQTGLPASSGTARTPGSNLDLIGGSTSVNPGLASGTSLDPGLISTGTFNTGTGLSSLGTTPPAPNVIVRSAADGSATQPAAAKSMGLVAVLAGRSHEAVYLKAAEKFNNAEYKECIEVLKTVGQNHQGSLETRQLYIAALVSMSRVYSAAYEAKLTAQAYPKTFFADDALAQLYKENPDLTVHFAAVENMCKSSTNPEMGILWAMYQRLNETEKGNASLTLSLLDVKSSDQEWFGTLKDGLKKAESPK